MTRPASSSGCDDRTADPNVHLLVLKWSEFFLYRHRTIGCQEVYLVSGHILRRQMLRVPYLTVLAYSILSLCPCTILNYHVVRFIWTHRGTGSKIMRPLFHIVEVLAKRKYSEPWYTFKRTKLYWSNSSLVFQNSYISRSIHLSLCQTHKYFYCFFYFISFYIFKLQHPCNRWE